MTTLNMHKAIEKIRLNDEPDSPEFVLDLTDESINRKSVMLAGCYATYTATMNALANGADAVKAKLTLSAIYKQAVIVMLGEEAYKTILEYLRNGTNVREDELTLVMAPLVAYLFERFDDVLTMNQNKAVIKYLEGNADGADTV